MIRLIRLLRGGRCVTVLGLVLGIGTLAFILVCLLVLPVLFVLVLLLVIALLIRFVVVVAFAALVRLIIAVSIVAFFFLFGTLTIAGRLILVVIQQVDGFTVV